MRSNKWWLVKIKTGNNDLRDEISTYALYFVLICMLAISIGAIGMMI